MLQFLWRDLSSDFDVLGPYFTLASSIDAQTLYSMVTKTILVFNQFGFTIRGLLSDGASSNLSLMKQMCNHKQGKGITAPWFISPLDDKRIYLIICPSHQVSHSYNVHGIACSFFSFFFL